ncbi:MAG TPA: LON peptidase substrate-binding domain-containing protein [Anaerolineales bacterium]|nr:LON peptidase substrate-binding domain-containing protein [Anaerolineales bacterium]
MYELALFPLNTVLYPGTPLQLHIFEERYQQMVGDCLAEEKPFGVVLIRRGVEALGALADPYRIGCTASIVDVERLADGRMNITAIGKDRFRILTLDSLSHPYLVGMVENYPIKADSLDELQPGAAQLLARLEVYLELLVEAGLIELDKSHLPAEPLSLAYLAAAVLQVPPIQKQQLLSTHTAQSLIDRLNNIFKREVALTRQLVNKNGSQQGPFSVN